MLLRVVAWLLLLALPTACSLGTAKPQAVVIGVGSTTEQRVLAAMTVAALERASVPTTVRADLGGTVGLRREALRGHVDVWWDHTGAAWALGMGEQAPPADPLESFQRVQRADEDRGLVWLEPSAANATLALFVRADALPPEGASRGLSWLAGELSSGARLLCADADFLQRRGGLDVLADAYAIGLDRLRVAAAGEEAAIDRVAAGGCFAGLATATSGLARAAGLIPVADELNLFPAFVAAPVVREPVLSLHPGIRPALERLARALDTRALAELNGQVEAGADPERVARDFVERVLEAAPQA